MMVIWRSGFRARRKAAVAPAIPQPMISTSAFVIFVLFVPLWLVFFPDYKHSFDGTQRATANVFVDHDLELLFAQRFERVFKCALVHVRTTHAAQPQHL